MVTVFDRDERGDVTFETRAGGVPTGFLVDGEQQSTSVTPPGELPHGMTYGLFDKLESYQPPLLGGTTPTPTAYFYDDDKNIDYIDPPEPGLGDMIDFGYDTAGRLKTVTFPGGALDRTYDPLTGHLQFLDGPYGVGLAYDYDGRFLKQVNWAGDVNATIDMYPDSDLRLALETVQGSWNVTFGYDNDSLLTSAGGLTLERDEQNGRVTSAASGNVVETFDYLPDLELLSYGELDETTATYSGTPYLDFSYDLRDGIGRILEKTETVQGAANVFKYQYDALGRLEYVRDVNNAILERYEYDDNGNRTLSTNSGGSAVAAAFDEQDRIQSYGDLTFEWTPNGELARKENVLLGDVTKYTYDALGNLTSVDANVGHIEYLVDGMGRRVGKMVQGTVTKKWLWRSQLQPVAELDGNDSVVARYVYGTGVNVPDQIVTATATYRLLKDHLGSVRLVVNQATGQVVQRFDYDSWGRIVSQSFAPGFNAHFQPFRFAGGFYDPDTGLVRFGARDYDPEIGRWTAKDPIRFDGGVNLYAYVRGDPVNFIDPEGNIAQVLVPAAEFAAAAAAAAGIVWAGGKSAQLGRCGIKHSECRSKAPETCDYRSSPQLQSQECDTCLARCLANMQKWWFLGDPWPKGCGGV
jgi:RHS repeat-associated protein